MKSKSALKVNQTIFHTINNLIRSVTKIAATMTAAPEMFKRVVEQFDSVQRYGISDGF